jgi:prepilin-type N-terminal cleavage/methylation domain-containing protein
MTHAPAPPARPRQGFTLVELLVVIAIIGVLVALLLPAIQAAREAARRSQCSNNLRQMALGAQNYLSANKTFPTGGWGYFWVGDANRGFGKDQPGGWVFNLLPYIEQDAMYKLASDGDRENITATQKAGTLRVLQSPLNTIRCPTRRFQNVFPKPTDGTFYAYNSDRGVEPVVAGRSDYGINSGDRDVVEGPGGAGAGPNGSSNNHSAAAGFAWEWNGQGIPSAGTFNETTSDRYLSGVCFQRSAIAIQQVSDGTSTTYLIGEKYLNPDQYETGTNDGDNETWCTGFNNDNFRAAFNPPLQDTPGVGGQQEARQFGSAHNAGWFVSWCDGHVDFQSYDIDRFVHRGNANRADGGRPYGAP